MHFTFHLRSTSLFNIAFLHPTPHIFESSTPKWVREEKSVCGCIWWAYRFEPAIWQSRATVTNNICHIARAVRVRPPCHVRTCGHKESIRTWEIAPMHRCTGGCRRRVALVHANPYEMCPGAFIILIHFAFTRVYVYSLCRSENFDVAYFSAAKPYVV